MSTTMERCSLDIYHLLGEYPQVDVPAHVFGVSGNKHSTKTVDMPKFGRKQEIFVKHVFTPRKEDLKRFASLSVSEWHRD